MTDPWSFSKMIIDCVGPLLLTGRGNQYILTVMCTATRFPEAIPLRSINSGVIVRELVNFFFFISFFYGLDCHLSSIQTRGVILHQVYSRMC